jgi:hypothetical protein
MPENDSGLASHCHKAPVARASLAGTKVNTVSSDGISTPGTNLEGRRLGRGGTSAASRLSKQASYEASGKGTDQGFRVWRGK